MRAGRVSALSWALLGSGCVLVPQTLNSPCVGKPADTDGGMCPACVTDADCSISTNECFESGNCVPTAGRWAVITIGCEFPHPPTTSTCVCLDSVCQAR